MNHSSLRLTCLVFLSCLCLPAYAQTEPTEGTDDEELIVLSCCCWTCGPDLIDEDAADAQFLADIEAALAVLSPGYLQASEETEPLALPEMTVTTDRATAETRSATSRQSEPAAREERATPTPPPPSPSSLANRTLADAP